MSRQTPKLDLTPLVISLKADNLAPAQQRLTAARTLTGSDLVNIARSVSHKPEALKLVLDDPRITEQELLTLINAATLARNNDLLAAIVTNSKASSLKANAAINRAYKNRPYDLAKLLTAQ